VWAGGEEMKKDFYFSAVEFYISFWSCLIVAVLFVSLNEGSVFIYCLVGVWIVMSIVSLYRYLDCKKLICKRRKK
jgi:uncharacterized membrane protein